MASVNKKHRALYYPFIEVRDPTWLLGATLFWDEISTITPNVAHPYTSRVSHELYEEGVLKPYRSNPQRREIVSISEKISEFITNPHFKSLIGLDHWSVQLSNGYGIYSDKIEHNLLYELEKLGKARKRSDGLIEMGGGLAAAYMLLLATEVAEKQKSSLVTDHVETFRAAEIARFPQSLNPNRFHRLRRERIVVQPVFVDACINEMITTWFRINPETNVKKILKFRHKRRDELSKLKNAIFRSNSKIITDQDITREGIQERARIYVQDNILPGYDELARLLKEDRISFIPETLEAALYSELPGGLVASLGQTWAIVAAPLFCFSIRSVKYIMKRRNMLKDSPWSYLYQAEKAFGATL